MERRRVNILCVQETKWKGSKARCLGAGYKLYYYGVESGRNGIGIVLEKDLIDRVLEVTRETARIISMKLDVEGIPLTVISAYAPQVGCPAEEREEFWTNWTTRKRGGGTTRCKKAW